MWYADIVARTQSMPFRLIGGLGMYRAIVVDDEVFMREGMRLMIDYEKCGFTLAGEAADSGQALALIEAKAPHLLITDVMMPGLQGTELAQLVAKWHPDMLIIFISGYRNFAFAKAAIRAQALGYLVKPIDPDAVHELLMLAKDTLDRRARRSGDEPEHTDTLVRTSETTRQALTYIEANYARELSVADIAGELHINPAYLGQVVRKNTGQTIHAHITRVRIEKACVLLRNTSMNVSEIAQSVGVTDVGYFSLLFARQMGVRPREYRKNRHP